MEKIITPIIKNTMNLKRELQIAEIINKAVEEQRKIEKQEKWNDK